MVGAVTIMRLLFEGIGELAQAAQFIQLQAGGLAVRRHHRCQPLLLIIGVVPLAAIRQQALAQFAVGAVLVFFGVPQRIGQRGQVALFIVMELPAIARRQHTFNQLPEFIITIIKRLAGRQFYFGQRTVRVVTEGGDRPCRVRFPDNLAMAPLAAGDAPQRVDFANDQPVRVIMVVGFTAFAVPIGGDARLIVIAEMVTPVATGGSHADDTPLFIISQAEIGLVGIMPADHPPLCIIVMPQVIVLERVTLMQVAVLIIMAGDQPLGCLLLQIIHGPELLILIT
ncbi:hypothetical protein Xbed_03742 [Xenorhabdus beddingii]|uniref:Uncharacterized protein n=1 Tax=Xenorhabdus beddingii TaxID=40578 RepID=A0A1Y2S642_9GAMM|nr:hypothetical protein Xbed_03742 [Xenorhabdus beddingii]